MAKTKVPDTGKFSFNIRCGDCLHFKGPANPNYDAKCSSLGIASYSRACKFFTPDLGKIRASDSSTEILTQVSRASAKIDSSQLRIMAYLLLKQGPLEKMGLRLGQALYLYLSPTLGMTRTAEREARKLDLNWLDCYYKGYIIGCIENGTNTYQLYISPSIVGKPDPYVVVIDTKSGKLPPHVMTYSQFKPLGEQLKKSKKRKMPRSIRSQVSKLQEIKHHVSSLDVAEVPTIDTVPESWFTKGISKNSLTFTKVKRGKPTKLVVPKSRLKMGKGRKLTLSDTDGD